MTLVMEISGREKVNSPSNVFLKLLSGITKIVNAFFGCFRNEN